VKTSEFTLNQTTFVGGRQKSFSASLAMQRSWLPLAVG